MRIVGGKYKKRRLATLRAELRPTSDRMREAVFDSLGPRVEGSVFLDAMAGSGAMGLEALSRGARRAIFNERDRRARRLIEKNLGLCGVRRGYELHSMDVFVMLREFRPSPRPDLLFFDPPYGFGRYRKLLEKLSAAPLLKSGAIAVVESFKKTDIGPVPERLEQINELSGGDSVVRFFEAGEPAGGAQT